LNIPGKRPAGIYSAGTAQYYVNMEGKLPGKEVVILGSGDIGLIMARRMTLEGAKVKVVAELMPYSGGLKRNIVQCLDDFGIPLHLNHTITEIRGDKRVTGVTISQVDQNKRPIKGTEKSFDCDTVLFSVGLIPENELSVNAGLNLTAGTKGVSVDQFRQTEIDGVFACGNVLQVHDLVDFVSEESEIAGKGVSIYLEKGKISGREIPVCAGDGVGYALPQRILADEVGKVKLFFRVRNPMKDVKIVLLDGDKVIMEKKKKVVLPGEMETITVTDKIYSSVNSLTLKVVQNG
jgi:pyruvate/2-oxoglutarate dehydrogenase complex dihydrolipoamide dehydrogenase (E3) component